MEASIQISISYGGRAENKHKGTENYIKNEGAY